MKPAYFVDLTVEKDAPELTQLTGADFEHCAFHNCNLGAADLTNTRFTECTFLGCDLSLAKLEGTSLNNTVFKNCKLVGLHLDQCSKVLLSVQFDDCILDLSSFYKLNLKKTRFSNCSMKEVDMTETDLSGATFINCDLADAIFDTTNLEKADLRSSYNYTLDPDKNRIKKARFSLAGLPGLLGKYGIVVEV